MTRSAGPQLKVSSDTVTLTVEKRIKLETPRYKVSKGAKNRNRYNQVPHLTKDTNGKVTESQFEYTTPTVFFFFCCCCLMFVVVFFGYNQYWSRGFMFFVVLCPGAFEGSPAVDCESLYL